MSPKLVISVILATLVVVVILFWTSSSDRDQDPILELPRPPSAASSPDETAQDGESQAAAAEAEPQVGSPAPAEPDLPQSVYDVVFGQPQPDNPIEAAHLAFTNEPRDESWASAMESGIREHIRGSEALEWATVDKIECRSSICEILGRMPDSMYNPGLNSQDLISDGFGLGWWTGVGMEVMSREHTYEDEGITRFMLIIVRIDEERLGPPE